MNKVLSFTLGHVHRVHFKRFFLQIDTFKLLIKYHTLYFHLGNISIKCHITDGTKQNKEYSTTELQKVNSRVNDEAIEDTVPFLTTMNTPINFSEVATRQFFMSSLYNATKIKLRDLDGILNNGVFHLIINIIYY